MAGGSSLDVRAEEGPRKIRYAAASGEDGFQDGNESVCHDDRRTRNSACFAPRWAMAMRRREFFKGTLGTAAAVALHRCMAAQSPRSAPSEVEAALANGGVISLRGPELKDLADTLHGRLLLPRDDGYDEARRLVSRRFDKHPAFIVQATGAADVGYAVDFAREHRLLLAVKGGGHSDLGISACDGGMMLDLSQMRGVRVEAGARRAWVAGATLAGLVDHETHSHGLAVPLGGSPTVGIGGLASGGGIGRLSRRFGLTLDSIRSLDVVTADGKLARASEMENADLLWAIRGGGGNFGVVTAFEFELHPIPARVVAGTIAFPFSQLRQVLSAYADYGASAPDELYLSCFLGSRGRLDESVLLLDACYSGDEANAERTLRSVRQFGRVIKDDVRAVSYLSIQGADVHPDSRVAAVLPARDAFFSAGFVVGIEKELAATIADRVKPHPARRVNILFLPAGGAIKRVPVGATAFPNRSVSHDMILVVSWELRDASAADHGDYARELWRYLKPATCGFYNNDMAGGVSGDAVAENFGENYSRLARLKAQYDAENVFRLNANIRPNRR
jgi:FAD/FMN-containing dehydrogenase